MRIKFPFDISQINDKAVEGVVRASIRISH